MLVIGIVWSSKHVLRAIHPQREDWWRAAGCQFTSQSWNEASRGLTDDPDQSCVKIVVVKCASCEARHLTAVACVGVVGLASWRTTIQG